MTKTYKIIFTNEKIRKQYENLKFGYDAEQRLYWQLNSAIYQISKNPYCGLKIKNSQIPKSYLKNNHDIIFKYDLPKGWRLIYSLAREDIEVIAVIIEWFDHKNYENRFNYVI